MTDTFFMKTIFERKKRNKDNVYRKRYKDNSFCRPKEAAEEDQRGRTLLQVQQDYNEAMAKLILVEGITGIGKTIEDNRADDQD